MHSLEEVGREADTVRSEIDHLFVRGLSASSATDRRTLTALAEEWERIGAGHVATSLLVALKRADAGAREAPAAFLSAYTSLHVFERLVSLEAAADHWSTHLAALHEAAADQESPDDEGSGGEAPGSNTPAPTASPAAATAPLDSPSPASPDSPSPASPAAAKPTPAVPPIDDPKGMLALADELSRAVEDLVRTGLAGATSGTRAKIDASFREASGRKLLRLGASLRYVNEEVGRFLADDGTFSARRFALFLHRSWLLARGLAKGIREKNPRLLASVLLTAGASAPRPVPWLEVVTMGVLKRSVSNAHTFEFRLRVVAAADPSLVGRGLLWSLVFARKPTPGGKPDNTPAEAYLQLPQPQKFAPKIFCEGARVKVSTCAVSLDDRGGGRLLLGPPSKAEKGAPYTDMDPFFRWDESMANSALDRVRTATPGPLDLAVELQEEVFLTGAQIADKPLRTSEGRHVHALTASGALSFDALIADGPDGADLLARLQKALKGSPSSVLYGLCYYEAGRSLLWPLSVFQQISARPGGENPPVPRGGKAEKPARAPRSPAAAKAGDRVDLVTLSTEQFDPKTLMRMLSM
ncbi:MAG: hypothetical protein R3B70_12100 [Polyangiaceae bacterium]